MKKKIKAPKTPATSRLKLNVVKTQVKAGALNAYMRLTGETQGEIKG